MAPKYKIALIQLHPKPLDPAFNFEKASAFIATAAQKGAHLAVLPEYHLTNWLPEDPAFAPICKDWEKYLKSYQTLAKDHKICIVPGTIVQLVQEPETGSDILINCAYFINTTGEILGRYQKKNLWHPERPHLTSSSHDAHETILDTPLGPVGLLICWDLAFPEAFRELIASGAKLIIIPTFWMLSDSSSYGSDKNPMSERLFLESTLTARAFENTCAICFVNAGAPAGEADEGKYAGLSRVCVPFVGALKDDHGEEAMGAEEGMSIVEVDMEFVEEAEKCYKVREDMEREGWHYTYRHKSGKL